jgi:uncharacterized damage-inducible protein DinB
MPIHINKPKPGEYPDYYQPYIDQLPDNDLLYLFEKQASDLQHMFKNINDARAEESYAEGKWTIKELLQHMLDSERIFAYRALCISRGEEASLPGYDENMYVNNSIANARLLNDMLEEYEYMRRSNILMIRSFTSEMLDQVGNANGKQVTLRGVIYVMAAHEVHHMNILEKRYLHIKH